MNKTCATCANHGLKGCRIMLSKPRELFCYADIETQLIREQDIVAYAKMYGEKDPHTHVATTIRQAKLNIARLTKMQEERHGTM